MARTVLIELWNALRTAVIVSPDPILGALDGPLRFEESFDEMPVLKTTQGHEEFEEAQKVMKSASLSSNKSPCSW